MNIHRFFIQIVSQLISQTIIILIFFVIFITGRTYYKRKTKPKEDQDSGDPIETFDELEAINRMQRSAFRQITSEFQKRNNEISDELLHNNRSISRELQKELFELRSYFEETRKQLQDITHRIESQNLSPAFYGRMTPGNLPPVDNTTSLSMPDRSNLEQLRSLTKNGIEYKAYYWALRLMNEMGGFPVDKFMSGFKYTAFGFFSERPQDRINYEEMIFGVIIYVDEKNVLSINPNKPLYIYTGGYAFPVVVRNIFETLHCNHPDPQDGTMACIAYSKVSTDRKGPAILTAKHVTGNVVGSPVILACGASGRILDAGPDGIDAALVSYNYCQLEAGKQIDSMQFVAPYMEVQFEGKSSGLIKTRITSITDTRGILNHHQLPARIFLGKEGTFGDSGALITDMSGEHAIGIYMGDYVDPAGGHGGVAQHAFQATTIMDMQLYKIK